MEISPSQFFGVNYEFMDEDEIRLKVKAMIIAECLNGGELDTLRAAWRSGMLESGETPSKEGRATLLGKGVLCQTSSKSNDYTFSVTYPLGYQVVRALCME